MNNQTKSRDANPFRICTLSDNDLQNEVDEIRNKCNELGVRVCRGGKMRTVNALFDEISAAFQFPFYFGENWAALEDCLADLSWFDADGYVLCIFSAHLILEFDSEGVSCFYQMLSRISSGWAGENPSLAVMGRMPLDFKIILQVPPEAVNDLEMSLPRHIN